MIILGIAFLLSIAFALLWRAVYGWQENKAKQKMYGIFSLSIIAFLILYFFQFKLNFVEYPVVFKFLYPISLSSITWISTLLLLILPLLVLAIIRFFINRHAETELNVSRRNLFKNIATILPAISFLGITPLLITASNVKRTHLTLGYTNLPAALKNLKIGQISDFHLGPYASINDLNNIFSRLQQDKVDVIFITGDLVDDIPSLPQLKEVLDNWSPKFPKGIYYIYGNHEYYRNYKAVKATLESSSLKILRNSHELFLDDIEQPVYLAGVDFPFGRGDETEQKMKIYVQKALEGIPANAFIILLAHYPDFIAEAFTANIPLTLAGHSHGGQINLLDKSVTPLNYKYWRGLYANTPADKFGYVSTGAGDWFPLRFDCPREYTVFSFKQAKDTNEYNKYK